MKLLSFNCNGIRSAFQKGLGEWLKTQNFEILNFQEIKATQKEIDINFFESLGYTSYIFPAEKKGYSGTATFCKLKPKTFQFGIGHKLFDSEGRTIILNFEKFILINTYFPSGTSGSERQKIKMEFLDYIFNFLTQLKKKQKALILCGDINIAHREIDIHNPKGNEKNSGFLPEERAWVSEFLNSGWIDCFRYIYPDKKDIYSWWTYRFSARKQNKGWRIDYFFVSEKLKKYIINSDIITEKNFSDHAPIFLELNL